MTDPTDPLKDGLTPPDYDEYGDAPESGDSAEPDEGGDPGNEPNPVRQAEKNRAHRIGWMIALAGIVVGFVLVLAKQP